MRMLCETCMPVISLSSTFSDLLTMRLLMQLVAGEVKVALQFGRDRLRHFQHGQTLEPHERQLLRDTLALLAYTNPAEAPMKYLTSDEHRQKVARIINAAILFHLKEQQWDASTGKGTCAFQCLRGIVATFCESCLCSSETSHAPLRTIPVLRDGRYDTWPIHAEHLPSQIPETAATMKWCQGCVCVCRRSCIYITGPGGGAAGPETATGSLCACCAVLLGAPAAAATGGA